MAVIFEITFNAQLNFFCFFVSSLHSDLKSTNELLLMKYNDAS